MTRWQKRALILSVLLNAVFLSLSGYYIFQRGGFAYVATHLSLVAGSTTGIHNPTPPHYSQKRSMFELLPHTEKSIVFLGDSITAGCEWQELLQNPRIKNRGINSDTTTGVLNRLDPIIDSKPDKIFLMIGVNDLSRGIKMSEIVANYDKILESIEKGSPDTIVYVQSVLPVNFNLYVGCTNAEVATLNKEIFRMSQRRNRTYVDLFTPMLAKDGQLNSEYTNDGLHLNGKGYNIWKDKIRLYLD